MPVPYKGKYAHQLLLAILYLIAEFLVAPTGEFPLNDDCAYSRALLLLVNDGVVNIGEWPAMTLLTNLLWGGLFVKTFGFSFFVLRASTMVVAMGGILIFYSLVRRLSGNGLAGFAASVTLLFNPCFFVLSNTFMTDVNFTVLLVTGIYSLTSYLNGGNKWWLAVFFLVSVLIVMLRQYGLILPVAFIVTSLMFRAHRWRNLISSVLILAVCALLLALYERHLAGVLGPEAEYKYVFGGRGEGRYLENLRTYTGQRLPEILVQVFMYSFPFALVVLAAGYRVLGWRTLLASFAASLLLFKYVFNGAAPLIANIVTNINVGPDTFFESLSAYYTNKPDHTHSERFATIFSVFKAVASVLSCQAMICAIVQGIRKAREKGITPATTLVLTVTVFYLALLLITPSYFDRYTLPLVALVMLLLAGQATCRVPLLSFGSAALFAWLSVAGTKDYFTVNRLRWEAYNHLTRDKGVDPADVHGGFETMCWDSKKYRYIFGADVLEHQKYLIQYTPEQNFKLLRSYPFQRYLPYRKDTVNIYYREQPAN